MKGLLLGGIFALPLLLGLRMRGFLQDRARHLETLEQAVIDGWIGLDELHVR